MIPIRFLMVLITVMFCFADSVVAGPWPRKQGSGFIQLGFSTIGYNKIYDDHSEKAPVFADVHDNVLQLFGEVGLTDLLTFTAAIPFKFISVSPQPTLFAPSTTKLSNSGIGDIDVAARYSLWSQDGYILSGGVRVGIPAGDVKDRNGLVLGDGEYNAAPMVLFGKSFYPEPAYITADVGFNFRGKSFSNELLYNIEAGYGFLDSRLFLILLISGKESTSSVPTKYYAATAYGLWNNNQEYTAIAPKVLYKVSEHTGISLSFTTAVHGRNIAGGFVFAAGVFHEF